MGDVVTFSGITRHDLDAEQILRNAESAGLESCIVIGFDADGDLYFAGSMADGAEALWLLQRSIHSLMKITDELEEG